VCCNVRVYVVRVHVAVVSQELERRDEGEVVEEVLDVLKKVCGRARVCVCKQVNVSMRCLLRSLAPTRSHGPSSSALRAGAATRTRAARE
jgi:hypothetical protein